ncbi:MAG TPA: lysophospholipid acyltransferase family protein [Caldilineaceae bacterium]|nr:lysophospholipid acyltransferase family protein [Caldilineaceae bacterium]
MKPPDDASGTWRLIHRLVSLVKPLFCRLTIEGAEHVPAVGGCVIACNHTLGPDYIVLGYASPRQIYYMAKTEIFTWHPLLNRLFASVGTFPVERGKGDALALQTAVETVCAGKALGMFPEGTRSRTGQLLRGKSGAARIALMAGAPVVPAVVINSAAILPTLFKLQRRPQVTVRFGPPVVMTGDPNSHSDARANTEHVMRAMAALLPPELRGIYGEKESTGRVMEKVEGEKVGDQESGDA